VASPLGANSPRVAAVRALATGKGRREQGRFAFEGPTLLAEARTCGITIAELYATAQALRTLADLPSLEASGTAVFVVDDRTAAKLSDVESPTGIVAVAPLAPVQLERIAALKGLILVLADLNEPGNAGTLLRSADAFGAAGVVFGPFGVEPYHPKVVRAAMGSLFRLPVGVGAPAEIAAAFSSRPIVGLASDGEPLGSSPPLPADVVLIVGHERHGLGAWEALCARRIAIPMRGNAESLNAGVAGSIALFEASRGCF
jgi:RNA methyltransferase, TrmH family